MKITRKVHKDIDRGSMKRENMVKTSKKRSYKPKDDMKLLTTR